MDHYIRFKNMRYNYEIEAAQCPPVPDLPSDKLGTEASKILQAAGAQACSTSASVQQAEVQAQVSTLLADASFGAKVSNSNTAAIGCEQLAVIANKYNKTVQNVACMLKTSKTVVKDTVKGINSINIESTNGSVKIKCGKGGLRFKQKMELKIIKSIQLSDKELTTIANEVNDIVKNVAEAVNDSKSGIGATPQGSKAITDTITNINTVDQKNKIDEQIKELTTNIEGGNTITIKAGDDVLIEGEYCEVNQDMVIDILATQIVDTAVSNSLSSLNKAVVENEAKVSQKAENLGAEALALKIKDVSGPGVMAYIMIMVIVIVIVIALYFLGSKLGAKALDKMPAQRYYRRK